MTKYELELCVGNEILFKDFSTIITNFKLVF